MRARAVPGPGHTPRPEPTPAERARAADDAVRGWSIPADVPALLCGGVIPQSWSAHALRTTARTLHTLIVRMRPETLVLVTTRAPQPPTHAPPRLAQVLAAGSIGARPPEMRDSAPARANTLVQIGMRGACETDLGPVQVDESVARALLAACTDQRPNSEPSADARILGDGGDPPDPPLVQACATLRRLAPGAGLVPIWVLDAGTAETLGRHLGACLRESPRVLVVAASDLTPGSELPSSRAPLGSQPVEKQPVQKQSVQKQPVEEQPVEKQPVEGHTLEASPHQRTLDTRMVRLVRELAAAEIAPEARTHGNAGAPAALVVAVAAAHARGARAGHVIEYGAWTADAPGPGLLGAVFG